MGGRGGRGPEQLAHTWQAGRSWFLAYCVVRFLLPPARVKAFTPEFKFARSSFSTWGRGWGADEGITMGTLGFCPEEALKMPGEISPGTKREHWAAQSEQTSVEVGTCARRLGEVSGLVQFERSTAEVKGIGLCEYLQSGESDGKGPYFDSNSDLNRMRADWGISKLRGETWWLGSFLRGGHQSP